MSHTKGKANWDCFSDATPESFDRLSHIKPFIEDVNSATKEKDGHSVQVNGRIVAQYVFCTVGTSG